ncbi:PASTA domain-containing protein [Streptomyces sp. NPDC016626]|uniref:PASTA domain-containing protein n=1 Tax=Streptomyces sp. NPDC016626 TaxID=3364968 RepID=UPI003702138D
MGFQNVPEGQVRRFLTSTAAALTILYGVTACGSGAAGEERGDPVAVQDEDESTTRPAKGPLDIAMKEKADQRKGFALRDATGLDRYVSPAHAKKFKVCFEKNKPNLGAVVIFAVRNSETCPRKVGTQREVGTTPNVVGMHLREAADRLVLAGYAPKRIHVDATGEPVSEARSWSYRVCEQSPAAGTPFSADLGPRLVIAASCRKE